MSSPAASGDERRILHVNITCFMAQTEARRDPSLRGRPFVVASRNTPRALVFGVSAGAFREGIRPGTDLRRAEKLVRGLPVVEPDPQLYDLAEAEARRILQGYTPLVESRGRGHFFLDLAGTRLLFGRAADCAGRIRADIIDRMCLHPSLALGSNKLVAKVGSRVVRPFGFAVIRPGDERLFLAPQSVGILPGVGPRISARLAALGVEILEELAGFSDEEARTLGSGGPLLRERARGVDDGRLAPAADRSFRAKSLFSPDTNDPGEIAARCFALIEEVALALRGENLECGALALAVTGSDGIRTAARENLPRGTSRDTDFFPPARRLLDRLLLRRVRLRGIEAELLRPVPAAEQLDLFSPGEEKKRGDLQRAADRLRLRYGGGILRVCSSLPG